MWEFFLRSFVISLSSISWSCWSLQRVLHLFLASRSHVVEVRSDYHLKVAGRHTLFSMKRRIATLVDYDDTDDEDDKPQLPAEQFKLERELVTTKKRFGHLNSCEIHPHMDIGQEAAACIVTNCTSRTCGRPKFPPGTNSNKPACRWPIRGPRVCVSGSQSSFNLIQSRARYSLWCEERCTDSSRYCHRIRGLTTCGTSYLSFSAHFSQSSSKRRP